VGELRNPRFIRWATYLEEACYRRTEQVVITATEIVERLIERGIHVEKIGPVRHGANVELFRRNPEARQCVRTRLGFEGQFVVLYAGLHGLAYDLEGAIDAAYSLRDETDIHFLLVGKGPTKEKVRKGAQELALRNVTFLPAQPREHIPDFINAVNVSIVPMKKSHTVGTLLIKIYDAMDCEDPVID
jgi:hypothetical protein